MLDLLLVVNENQGITKITRINGNLYQLSWQTS